jgi:hypothetical protein
MPTEKLWDKELKRLRLISGSIREVDENRVLLGCYAAGSDKSLPMFRDNLSASSSRENNSRCMTI